MKKWLLKLWPYAADVAARLLVKLAEKLRKKP